MLSHEASKKPKKKQKTLKSARFGSELEDAAEDRDIEAPYPSSLPTWTQTEKMEELQ